MKQVISFVGLSLAVVAMFFWYYLLWFILSAVNAPTVVWCIYATYLPVAFAGSLLTALGSASWKDDS